jgi:predicted nucleic acid-binding Zn ribbon protein
MMPTGVGLVFKGSGFYATDYAAKKRQTEEKEKNDPESDKKKE